MTEEREHCMHICIYASQPASQLMIWSNGSNWIWTVYLIWKCLKVAFSWIFILILPLSSTCPHTTSFISWLLLPPDVPFGPQPPSAWELSDDELFLRRSLCPANRLRQLLFASSNSDSSWNLSAQKWKRKKKSFKPPIPFRT